MSHSKKIGAKLIMEHYRRGREDQKAGRPYSPANDPILRRAYSEAVADEIMDVHPTEKEILWIVQG
jgi:hypothetical protein